MNHEDEDKETSDLVPVTPNTQVAVIQDEELAKDYEFAKSNMQNIIYKGNEVLDELQEIAMASQQARAFEVYTNLLKVIADTNKQLLESSLLNQQIIEKKRQNNNVNEPKQTINNNLIMTTAQLAEMISGKKL